MAHSIAVISVQAGVAAYLLPDQPARAQDALAHVRGAAATVLDELGGLLDVLRSDDEQSAATTPAPGLDRLEDLVASFAPSGLQVRWSVTGQPQPLTSSVDLVAYRVVQEALTNAAKHGTGSAALTVRYGEGSLELEIENAVTRAESGVRTGHGLLGMQERARAVGGSVLVAPQVNARFRVTIVLPLSVAAVAPEPVPAR